MPIATFIVVHFLLESEKFFSRENFQLHFCDLIRISSFIMVTSSSIRSTVKLLTPINEFIAVTMQIKKKMKYRKITNWKKNVSFFSLF